MHTTLRGNIPLFMNDFRPNRFLAHDSGSSNESSNFQIKTKKKPTHNLFLSHLNTFVVSRGKGKMVKWTFRLRCLYLWRDAKMKESMSHSKKAILWSGGKKSWNIFTCRQLRLHPPLGCDKAVPLQLLTFRLQWLMRLGRILRQEEDCWGREMGKTLAVSEIF